jgi:signal transduction histidine kinase
VKSLRTRLLLAYAGLILIGFTVLALVAGRQIMAGTMQDFMDGIAEQARLVARVMKEPVEEWAENGADQSDLSSSIETYAEQVSADLQLLDYQGRILASSSGSDTNVDVVRTALNGSVSTAAQGSTAYAAAPILEEGQVIGIVQLAIPINAARVLVWERWLMLGAAVLTLSAMAGLAAYWLSTTLTRPLAEMQSATIQIAQGDFSQRLPETRQDEIGQLAHAFNYMADQVEAMIEEQRSFASNASHELRTPLTAIRLRSEALRDGDLDAATEQQYVVEIDEEVKRMGDLVQDLLMLSRLDSGRLEAGREQIDSIRMARQLLGEIAPQTQSHSIAIELDTPSELPLIEASSAHLMIVFRNLLANALKYTPDGGRITWRIRANGDQIHYSISDTGQGISAEDLPYVFDRFYRVDKSRSREVPGVGLGLSLVRMIVEFYGGTVYLTSEGVGQGTTSNVTWPC